MYQGYLVIGGVQVINNHRVTAYAENAGLPWVQSCIACASIAAGRQEVYTTPLKEVVKPPWWGDGSDQNALNFLGFMGIEFANVDDSVRGIETTAGIESGGYLGPLRYGTRTITVRAIAVATDDCALGFGINWLRHVDTALGCATSTVDLFECCPTLAAADCSDPACAKACTDKVKRQFHDARITAGPTILRRREMSTRGAMAELEFIITAGDPYIYAPASAVPVVESISAEVIDQPEVATDEPVDGFAQNLPYPRPPSLVREPRFLPRDRWLRDTYHLPTPDFGVEVTPNVTLWAETDVSDVRLTLIGPEGVAGVYRMNDFPADGVLTLDFRARKVTTESHGIIRSGSGFVRDAVGAPLRWPRGLPRGGYELWVDRSPESAPLVVDIDVAGRVSA